jgi:hypothetical protein
MEFLSRTQLIAAVGAVGLALFVLDLVRRRKLSEEYSFVWILCTVTIAVLGFSTPALRFITHALGVLYESSTVFAAGVGLSLVLLLFLSVKLSRLSRENAALAREIALLRYRLEDAVAAVRNERTGA